jgi:hypothetical protein
VAHRNAKQSERGKQASLTGGGAGARASNEKYEIKIIFSQKKNN